MVSVVGLCSFIDVGSLMLHCIYNDDQHACLILHRRGARGRFLLLPIPMSSRERGQYRPPGLHVCGHRMAFTHSTNDSSSVVYYPHFIRVTVCSMVTSDTFFGEIYFKHPEKLLV